MNIDWNKLGLILCSADWNYQYADDGRAYAEGERSARYAQDAWALAYTVEPERALEVLAKNFPPYCDSARSKDGSGWYIDRWHTEASKRVGDWPPHHVVMIRDWISSK